ncbi:hypothetical protein KIPB_006953, partial [Kipferlia bialata]|eukprot:g6953.t1
MTDMEHTYAPADTAASQEQYPETLSPRHLSRALSHSALRDDMEGVGQVPLTRGSPHSSLIPYSLRRSMET